MSYYIIAAGHLKIGKDCVFSSDVFISDCNHSYVLEGRIAEQPLTVLKTEIGNNVFIGTEAKIMAGVTTGDNAVIGANAVVMRDVPPREIWGGTGQVNQKEYYMSSCLRHDLYTTEKEVC